MPELWELCNKKSQATLMLLYTDEQGCFPDFYYQATGNKRKPDIINAPDYEEEQEIDIDIEMRQSPHSPRRVE